MVRQMPATFQWMIPVVCPRSATPSLLSMDQRSVGIFAAQKGVALTLIFAISS
jgi:hypothetical protein